MQSTLTATAWPIDVGEWMKAHHLTRDQLTLAIANICRLIREELDKDREIYNSNKLPGFVLLPVRFSHTSL